MCAIMMAESYRNGEIFMWNCKKSVILSIIFCFIISVMLTACAFLLPCVLGWFLRNSQPPEQIDLFKSAVLTCYYVSMPFAAVTLFSLIKMLFAINREEIFIDANIRRLRRISWCCFAVAIITLIGSYFYHPIVIIAIAAGFMGLIIRVVKNVMNSAKLLREENDLTI